MNNWKIKIGFLLCLGVLVGPVLATTPVIIVSGQITNQAAQLLSNLQVSVENQDQQQQVTATSNANGIYRAVFFNPDQTQTVGVAQVGDQIRLRVYAQDQTLLLSHSYQLTTIRTTYIVLRGVYFCLFNISRTYCHCSWRGYERLAS